MRITYRQLQQIMSHLSEDQLDSDVTIELEACDCLHGDFAIASSLHEGGLEINHPVFRVRYNGDEERATNAEIASYIDSLHKDNAFGNMGD